VNEAMTSGKLSPKVAIILLNLNGYDDTRDCLQSLDKVHYTNFNVIVVDNGSTDGSGLRIEREFPHARVLHNKKNLGFAGGNNVGIEYALRQQAAYVLLLNNDTIVDPAFLSQLVECGEADPGIGILGPKIFYASEPTRIWYAGGCVHYRVGKCSHRGENQVDNGQFSDIEETPFVTGCALLIKSTVLQDIGLLDSRLFIYWEDSDYCMRAQKAGYRCTFVPNALVWHKVTRTCGSGSAFTIYLFSRNRLVWIKRHVPFPYKPVVLAFNVARMTASALKRSLKGQYSAAPLWAAIRDFLLGVYGPPRRGDQPQAVEVQGVGPGCRVADNSEVATASGRPMR
jgi:GT2 family glycosyltransferase